VQKDINRPAFLLRIYLSSLNTIYEVIQQKKFKFGSYFWKKLHLVALANNIVSFTEAVYNISWVIGGDRRSNESSDGYWLSFS